MDCNEARQHWDLYHDSEGDVRLHFEIEEHLGRCSECAEWFAKQSRLEAMLEEKLRCSPRTPQLWDRVLTQTGLKRPRKSRHWLWMAGLAGCAAVLLAAALWLRPFDASPKAPPLDRLSADWHERICLSGEPLQFQSGSDLAVENYLRGRVPFPVRCPPRKDAGFAVRGAGIGDLGGFSAAYLAGEVDATPVSIFVLPRDSLASFPEQREAVRRQGVYHSRTGGYSLAVRAFDRNAIVVIGRTGSAALERVVNAYGSYPDHH